MTPDQRKKIERRATVRAMPSYDERTVRAIGQLREDVRVVLKAYDAAMRRERLWKSRSEVLSERLEKCKEGSA